MASRKPLVLNAGQIQQLQASDTLAAPLAGAQEVSLTNDDVGSHVPGQVVYLDTNDGVKKAQANTSATAYAFAFASTTVSNGVAGVYATDGILSLTTGQWDSVMGSSGGLTAGTIYYLSAATAGLGTATAPSAAGQYVVRLGIALSTTELSIGIRDPILL